MIEIKKAQTQVASSSSYLLSILDIFQCLVEFNFKQRPALTITFETFPLNAAKCRRDTVAQVTY